MHQDQWHLCSTKDIGSLPDPWLRSAPWPGNSIRHVVAKGKKKREKAVMFKTFAKIIFGIILVNKYLVIMSKIREMSISFVTWSVLMMDSSETKKEVIHNLAM